MIDELPFFSMNQLCDNQETVNKVNRPLTPNDMLKPYTGIVLSYQKLRKQTKAPVSLYWIKGHRGKKKHIVNS